MPKPIIKVSILECFAEIGGPSQDKDVGLLISKVEYGQPNQYLKTNTIK